MKHPLQFLLAALLSLPLAAHSRIYEGIEFVDSLTLPDTEQPLMLNGIGMRTKFVFDVYIGALYTEKAVSSRDEIHALTGPKRVLMHFVYDEVSAEKLVEAWNEGFEDNNSEQKLAMLKDRIDQFNALFTTVRSGDEVLLDYIPMKGTVVSIRGQQVGVIDGMDFYAALLDIWLGEEPADDDLKESLLGKQ